MVKPVMAAENNNPGRSSEYSCKYKGVRKRKWGKWVSEIRLPNSRDRIWLGSYDTPEKAARAFDAALYCLRGSHAEFNFSDTPLEINIGSDPLSLTPQEIQEFAARFANEPGTRGQHESDHNCPEGGETFESNMVNDEAVISYGAAPSAMMRNGTGQQEMNDTNNNMMDMDWSFLNLLDSNEGVSDFPFYSELEKMHSGELFPPPPAPAEDNEEENDVEDVYSQQSFLWNF